MFRRSPNSAVNCFLHLFLVVFNKKEYLQTWKVRSKLLAAVILVRLFKKIISVLMKLDFYYSLEAMQHAGSIKLWENVNIHRHISNPKITLQRWTAIRIYTVLFLYFHIYSLSMSSTFIRVYHTACFRRLHTAYCGLPANLSALAHLFLVLYVFMSLNLCNWRAWEKPYWNVSEEEVTLSNS